MGFFTRTMHGKTFRDFLELMEGSFKDVRNQFYREPAGYFPPRPVKTIRTVSTRIAQSKRIDMFFK
jgi:hypothetical protein